MNQLCSLFFSLISIFHRMLVNISMVYASKVSLVLKIASLRDGIDRHIGLFQQVVGIHEPFLALDTGKADARYPLKHLLK